MHDTLAYFGREPVHRSHHQDALTFRMLYAYDENFVLSLSHDEVVHGKGSLVSKMPGDEWQQFANLRALYGYQYGLPGKKCLFMGGEFGQRAEWAVDHQLEWSVLDLPNHAGLRRWVQALNGIYATEPALSLRDHEPDGFEWIDTGDAPASVVSFVRKAPGARTIAVVLNLTPVPRPGYRIGVPEASGWKVLLDSDDPRFWGSGAGPAGPFTAEERPMHGRAESIVLDLAPLSALLLGAV
jgi:1,4-alpha-glucan branching enzyme